MQMLEQHTNGVQQDYLQTSTLVIGDFLRSYKLIFLHGLIINPQEILAWTGGMGSGGRGREDHLVAGSSRVHWNNIFNLGPTGLRWNSVDSDIWCRRPHGPNQYHFHRRVDGTLRQPTSEQQFKLRSIVKFTLNNRPERQDSRARISNFSPAVWTGRWWQGTSFLSLYPS